jgi:hypothetical protein
VLPSPFLRSIYAPTFFACALTFAQRFFDASPWSNDKFRVADKPPETRRKEPESETGAPDKANAMPRYASLRKLFSTVLVWDCVGLGQ